MQMRFRGGYNISLQGRPDGAIKVMPEPDVLYLPLCSRRFAFNELNVKDGQNVNSGDVLAKDTDNYAVPLLASRAGTIRLKPAENHGFAGVFALLVLGVVLKTIPVLAIVAVTTLPWVLKSIKSAEKSCDNPKAFLFVVNTIVVTHIVITLSLGISFLKGHIK